MNPCFAVPTYSGQLVDLLAPRPEQISREAIAHHLSLTARWVGATRSHLSVAQHSLLVCSAVRLPRARIFALLHDAHEFVLGDVTTPAERALEALVPGAAKAINGLKARLDRAIWDHFCLPIPDAEILTAVIEADRQLAATEWRDCLPDQPCPSPYLGTRTSREPIVAQPPAKVEIMFLDRLEQLLALEAHRHAGAEA